MKRTEKASHYFRNGYNCSQSVLVAFAPGLGISEDVSLKVACAFGGGMGRQQRTCGAVTGALMALGLQYGKGLRDEESKKQNTYTLARAFCREFEQRHGSLNCRQLLLNLDMNNPEENRKISELGLSETRCRVFVENAVEILETLLLETPG